MWVVRLGPAYEGMQFRGEVVGVGIDEQGPYPAHYIVRLLDPVDEYYPFDYIHITGACLDDR